MTLKFCLTLILCPLVSMSLHLNNEFMGNFGLNRRTFSSLYRDLQNTYPRLRDAYLASPLANPRPNIRNVKKYMTKRPHSCRGCNHKGHTSNGKPPKSLVYFTDFVPIENPYPFVSSTATPSTGYLRTEEHRAKSNYAPSTTSRAPQNLHYKHNPLITTTSSPNPSQHPHKSVNSISSSALGLKEQSIPPLRRSPFSNNLKRTPSGFNIEIDHSNGYSYMSQSLGSSSQ